MSASVEVLTPQSKTSSKSISRQSQPKEDVDGWQTVRSRCRRGSTHNLNMSTRFHKPSTTISLPALCIDSALADKNKKNDARFKRRTLGGKTFRNGLVDADKAKGDGATSERTGFDGKLANANSKVRY